MEAYPNRDGKPRDATEVFSAKTHKEATVEKEKPARVRLTLREVTVDAIKTTKELGLLSLLDLWEEQCQLFHNPSLVAYAQSGVQMALVGRSLMDVWRPHHVRKEEALEEHQFSPPKMELDNTMGAKKEIKHVPPGDRFRLVANDLLQMMQVCVMAAAVHGVGAARWNWETCLMEKMKEIGEVTRNIREVAMTFCLILSAATPDLVCIECTVSLFAAGLLVLEKLELADEKVVTRCIRSSGIYRRVGYLKEFAKQVNKNHQGRVPSTYEDLVKFDGVGPKTAVLVMNEVFGITTGIGVDTHVISLSQALGFTSCFDQVNVENSLLTWVPTHKCKLFNPILGSFVQIFVQNLGNMKGKDAMSAGRKVMVAAHDHIHKPYHVRLLWYAIARCRYCHFVANAVKVRDPEKGKEEDKDKDSFKEEMKQKEQDASRTSSKQVMM